MLSLAAFCLFAAVFPEPATDYDFSKLKIEKLGRGVVAFRSGEREAVVSWRYRRQDPAKLPKDSEWRGPILAGYLKMMESLRKWQRPNGLWGQLVDDPESYDETSATAMFAYAFAEGAKSGVLGEEYRVAAVKAYNALVRRMDRL